MGNLKGPSYQLGSSAGFNVHGVPAYVDASVNLIPDSENQGKYYYGITTATGVGTRGVDIYADATNTVFIDETAFNIWDELSNAWEAVKSWF
ncbi:MAG: hypothetical protein IJO64_00145 [Clostridia bacterium]|nr:hypothetical protein [Clostridia bacterium]